MKHLTLFVVAFALSTAAAAAPALTKAQVRKLVEPTEAQVKSCAQSSGVYGTLRVRFNVKADGSVADFTSLAPHQGDAGAKCAEDAISALKFPESSKGRASKYRFQLGGPKGAVFDALKLGSFAACPKATTTATFTVGADGSASGVSVGGKHTAPDVGSCVSDVISKLKFPPQAKPTKYTVPVKSGS